MTEQFHLQDGVADLRKAIQDAWSTDSEYEAHLLSSHGQPEVLEYRLSEQVNAIYVQLAFLLEASRLPEQLAAFKADMRDFRQTRKLGFSSDEYGNLYCKTLEQLATYVSPLVVATSSPSGRSDDLLILEQVLNGTARLLRDFKIEPSKEADVRNALYHHLIHVFPGTEREVPIPKISQKYRADLGIRSLKTAIEIKFSCSDKEMRRAIRGVFKNVAAYAGLEEWKHFYALFYVTDAFMTQAQLEEEFKSSGDHTIWKPLVVQGRGARR